MDKKQLAQLKKDYKDFYVIFYEIIGSRCNGTYLVKAKNGRTAQSMVRDLDYDYVVRERAHKAVDWYLEVGEEDNLVTEVAEYTKKKDPSKVPFGVIECLECGT